jgi:predicted enzyme related to lactoylglutathione lyase
MIAPVNRIIVFVANVEVSAAFFEHAFELNRVQETYTAGQWLELQAGGCKLAFHKAYGKEGPIDEPTGGPDHPFKIVFYAENIPEMKKKLERKGVRMGEIKQFGNLALCDGVGPENHPFQISNRP